jgi:hypothetical protein
MERAFHPGGMVFKDAGDIVQRKGPISGIVIRPGCRDLLGSHDRTSSDIHSLPTNITILAAVGLPRTRSVTRPQCSAHVWATTVQPDGRKVNGTTDSILDRN